MKDTPLTRLLQCGQSLWLDGISRALLISGELVSLIQHDGVSGMSWNPAGLERAVAAGEYDRPIATLAGEGMSAARIYQTLVAEDVRMAADLLRPLYDRLAGRDGLVSVPLSPHLAHDGAGTVWEARRLWELVARPNLLIQVPATGEGVAALRQLVREGINVDATVVLGVPRYRAVAEAYLDALAQRAARGLPLAQIASVASVSPRQIDALVDPLLARVTQQGGERGRLAAELQGEVAVACAKALRIVSREFLSDNRYLALSARGGRPMRLLWGGFAEGSSPGDLGYPEALIGPDTVTCLPLQTVAAYRERGFPALRLDRGLAEAVEVLEKLNRLDVDLYRLVQQLEEEGVERLARPFDSVMRNIALKRNVSN